MNLQHNWLIPSRYITGEGTAYVSIYMSAVLRPWTSGGDLVLLDKNGLEEVQTLVPYNTRLLALVEANG
jgi:hypothetical protein